MGDKERRAMRWERWKREQIAAAAPEQRKHVREMLDGVPAPTPEDDRRMERIEKLVNKVFGGKKKRRR